MKSFIAALLAACAVADNHSTTEWTAKPECATFLDQEARWLSKAVADGTVKPFKVSKDGEDKNV